MVDPDNFTTIMPDLQTEGNVTESWMEVETLDVPTLAKNYSYFKASLAVNMYYSPILIVCGLFGNTLSVLVMLQVSPHPHPNSP